MNERRAASGRGADSSFTIRNWTGRWTVSTRSRSRLVAKVEAGPLSLVVLGKRKSVSSPSHVERRLLGLLKQVLDTETPDIGLGPLPAPLRRALTSLLDWHAELEPSGRVNAMCSLIMYASERRVACGHIGGRAPRILVNDFPIPFSWFVLENSSGLEARAIALEALRSRRIALAWTGFIDRPVNGSPLVEAQWSAEEECEPEPPAPEPYPALQLVSVPEASHAPPLAQDSLTTSAGADASPEEPTIGVIEGTADAGAFVAAHPEFFPQKLARWLDRVTAKLVGKRPTLESQRAEALPSAIVPNQASAANVPVEPPPLKTAPDSGATPLRLAVSTASVTSTVQERRVEETEMPAGVEVKAPEPRSAEAELAAAIEILGRNLPPSAYHRSLSAVPAPSLGRAGSWEGEASAHEESSPRPALARDAQAEAATAPERETKDRATPEIQEPATAEERMGAPQDADAQEPKHLVTAEAAMPAPQDVGAGEQQRRTAETPAPESRYQGVDSASFDATEDVVAGTGAFDHRHVGSAESPAPAQQIPTVKSARMPARPAWPSFEDPKPRAIPWQRLWPWVAAVVGLFSCGWLLGQVQLQPDARRPAETAPFGIRLVRAVGLGGAWYRCTVSSDPAGAWIAVDGKELARRTPARLELSAGVHTVSLTLADLGSVSYTVRGQKGDRIVMEVPLWGSLRIEAENPAFPIAVSVDGKRRGFAPITIEKLKPGPHEVLFSAPGTPPWGQTVDVPVDRPAELVAHPFQSPATGLIEVRASIASDRGTENLKGAAVWVDGVRRGNTPLKLELSRGPHSVRVVYRDEEAPVQVIDLPGGNQRFADFLFGTGIERPRFTQLSPTGPLASDNPEVVSVRLDEVRESDVSEMWLHVRTREGIWRRYPMVILPAPGGVVGTAVFPVSVLDGRGRALYYTRALTAMGDEYFTELRDAQASKPAARHERVRSPAPARTRLADPANTTDSTLSTP